MAIDKYDKDDGAGCGNDAMNSGDAHCASLKLRQHLNKLPQELYDEIYDLTFTAESRIRVYTQDGSWLASLRRPSPGVFSDRDATFPGEFPPGFPVPSKDISKRDIILNEQLPPILQANRADRNAFSLTFFGERDSDWEISESAKIPISALDRIITFNEFSPLLHVDRASRQKFAESFFGNKHSIFVFWHMFRWTEHDKLRVLKNYVPLMKDIRFGVPRDSYKTTLSMADDLRRYVFRGIGNRYVLISNEEIEELVRERIGKIEEGGVAGAS
ncbi:hypothetical protein CKM354_000442100 [Cercospora kikuchii]|uniref:Uncharacterized protein n=1 Tax=Cercospora kikuchii TaxID=84275 RepID=A0A9P3CIK3_9PEZI|nr:uncharacterized protein CKM354_000442100 [Cercospora kikuchii]GIZ41105.1 hypothetical protein CKM354_000442100 [Cercospora kikuchii]